MNGIASGGESLFCCPVCGLVLRADGGNKALACGRGHSFDRAAEGYVHLLLPNLMHSKVPGDSPDMVSARARFLGAGLYEPFRRGLVERAAALFSPSDAPRVLDIGCGEGYYTVGLAKSIGGARTAALDISKAAVKKAAKRASREGAAAEFAVASAYRLPMADGSAELAVSVFSPVVPDELARVVRPGGFALLALPAPRHLYGLKEKIYDEPYENGENAPALPGFRTRGVSVISESLALSGQALIYDLFAMTPYFWKSGFDAVKRLRALDRLETEAAFELHLFERE